MNEFLTAKLITQGVYDDITSTSTSAYNKASRAVRELQRGISDSSNPKKRLKETCDVLKKLEDELLNNTIAEIQIKANDTGTLMHIMYDLTFNCYLMFPIILAFVLCKHYPVIGVDGLGVLGSNVIQ